MSYVFNKGSGGGGGGALNTLTGNAGGIVSATAGNINIVGAGGVTVTGNPGTSTLVITDVGSLRSTTYVATTPYTVLLTDDVVLVDTATIAGASTIKLPNAASDGQLFTIKDWSGSAATDPITLTTIGGAVLIDGATTFLLNKAHESVSVVYSVGEGTYSIVSEVNASTGITTIDGDSGSVTGTTVTIKSGLSTNNSGETVDFVGAGTVLTFNVTDANSNTTVGNLAGKAGMTGSANSGFGALALAAITTGLENTAAGYGALSSITSDNSNTAFGFTAASSIVGGSFNTAVGNDSLTAAVAASYNTAIGYQAGSMYTSTESGNISINSKGVVGESNTLRIGAATGSTTQDLQAAYIAGIRNVNVGSTLNIVTNTGTTDQLGTALLTAGAGITLTPTANVITIASSSAASTTYVATTPYTVLVTDDVLLVDTVTIAAPSTILLPNGPTTDGKRWTIKDWSGGAATHNITVTTVSGADLIDGATTFVMSSNYESITVVWSATEDTFSIISEVITPVSSALTITTVNHAASPYTVLSTDQFISVDSSGGVVTIRLPNTTTTGRVIDIKDATSSAATNNITLTTPGGTVTIDGGTSFVMNTNYQSTSVIFNGSNYLIF